MNKEKFIETLKKNNIPAYYHELWWSKSKYADPSHKNKFGFGGNQEELDEHIKTLKEKGRITSAPW